MKLVLSEDNSGIERSFEQAVVRVGRDPLESDIVLERSQYPMVSRRHAEFRFIDGGWFIVDLDSTYGTFLNGQRLSGGAAISEGSSVRFGESGPSFRVRLTSASVETPFPKPAMATSDPDNWSSHRPAAPDPFTSKAPLAEQYQRQSQEQRLQQEWHQTPPETPSPQWPGTSPQIPPQVQQPVQPVQRQAPVHRSLAGPAEIDFVGTARPRLTLGQNIIWIGRDPSCEIRFDPGDVMVSRKHASIALDGGNYVVEDNKSFNGTLVNGQRITSPTPVFDGDQIQLGSVGPVLKLIAPGRSAPVGGELAGQRSISIGQMPSGAIAIPASSKTMSISASEAADLLGSVSSQDSAEPQLLMQLGFGEKRDLTIGRDASNDITLDGLQISTRHARLINSGGEVYIEDLNSTNGVFVNGARVTRQALSPVDSAQIGTFLVRVDQAGNILVFDTRSKTRIDAVGLTREVKNRFGGGKIRLLDGVSLSIQPNEFVGILGPSGSGKSTLIDALNGMRPAHPGNVLINNLDLYRHFDSLKSSLGYVPQDDIIHRELSVWRTLYYVARLRLPRDVSRKEINQTINEVLDVTGLAERRNVRIDQLSGGQRKRVSMAVELITRPSVIFLDEPTSGLDPATEEKIMKLFQQIAQSGRTVIMTTHAMENVKLFDKVVILMRGRLVFYGPPAEALKHLGAASYKDIFDKLEEPVGATSQQGKEERAQAVDTVAENWKQKFLTTQQFTAYVGEPLRQLGTLEPAKRRKKRRLGIFGSIRQFFTLSRRYLEILLKDKLSLFILFAQAPVIALMTFFVAGSVKPRDFVYFVLALVAVWFGTSVSAREIIREWPIYRRERMVNLGILPYYLSKLFILGIIVAVQCFLLFVPLKLADLVGVMPMQGEYGGAPQFFAMLLTAGVGLAVGLFISAIVRTENMATGLVPLILIPQILFGGLAGVPTGVTKVVSMTMPAAWSFDTIKRFSTLDTLESEGSDPEGPTKGLGLYKFIETENDNLVAKARQDFKDYEKRAETEFRKYDDAVHAGQNPPAPDPGVSPVVPAAKKIPEDLSGFVTFLHPWMNEVVNQLVLMVMFGILALLTLIVLRLQDIR